MTDALRRLLAFVAGVVVEGHQAEGVFDFEVGSRFAVIGSIDDDRVDVTDATAGVRLHGRLPRLEREDGGAVELHIAGDDICGIDQASGTRFSGRVSGRNIDLDDERTGQRHIYCL